MKTRTITALIFILVCFPIVIFGNWPFYLLVYGFATIGLIEFVRIRGRNIHPFPLLTAILLMWLYLFPISELQFAEIFHITKTEITLLAVLILVTYTVLSNNKFMFEDAGFFLIAAVYLGLGLHYFIMARQVGIDIVFFGILIIIASDAGAYFIGRKIGKRKLWPQISPNKTIEGALGGVLAACIVALVFQFVWPVHSSWLIVLIVAVLASMAGQLGDLVESAFKRFYKVKDSGNLFPGHGGVLDRFDSWLFVFPLLFIIRFIS